MHAEFTPTQMASGRRVLALCREMAKGVRQGQGLQADMNEIRDWISARPARAMARSVSRRENRVVKQLDEIEISFDETDRKLSEEKISLEREGVDPDLVVAAALMEELGNRAPELRARIQEIATQKQKVFERMDAIETNYNLGTTRKKFVGLRKKFMKLNRRWDQLDKEFWQHAVGDLQLRDEQINA